MKKLYVILLLAIVIIGSVPVLAEDGDERDAYTCFKEYCLEYDLTVKSDLIQVRFQNEIIKNICSYAGMKDFTGIISRDENGALVVIMPGKTDETVTFTTPLFSDMDGNNSYAGIGIMEHLIENWEDADAYFTARFVFLPSTFVIYEGKATYVLGGLVGGDRLFCYNLSAEDKAESAIKTSMARLGIASYDIPDRFNSGKPAGLEYYTGCIYLERSLWWYDTESSGSYVGTRWYQTQSENYADTEGRICGFGQEALEQMGRTFGQRAGMIKRLNECENIILTLLQDKDIFLNELPSVPTIPVAPSAEIQEPSSDQSESEISEPEIETEGSQADNTTAALGHEEKDSVQNTDGSAGASPTETSVKASEETVRSGLYASDKDMKKRQNPVGWVFGVLFFLGAAAAAYIAFLKKKQIRQVIYDLLNNLPGRVKKGQKRSEKKEENNDEKDHIWW